MAANLKCELFDYMASNNLHATKSLKKEGVKFYQENTKAADLFITINEFTKQTSLPECYSECDESICKHFEDTSLEYANLVASFAEAI